jgi:hypothetical protein
MYEDVLDRLSSRKPSKRSASQASKQPDNQTPVQPRIKATFYLTREDIVAIDRLQIGVFLETGKKPERSQIVSQSIQLLARHQKSAG